MNFMSPILVPSRKCAQWRQAHALHAAGDHDLGGAELDLLRAQRNRAQSRPAQLVHAPGRGVDGNAGTDGRLPRRVLARTGGEDLPHDDLGDLAGLHARALERRLDGNLAEIVRRQAGERAVEGADRCSGGTGDDDGCLILAHTWLHGLCGLSRLDSSVAPRCEESGLKPR